MAYRDEERWRGWEPGRKDREWYGSGREGRNDWEGPWGSERYGGRGADPEYERYLSREGYRPPERGSPREYERWSRGGRGDYPRPYSSEAPGWYGAEAYGFTRFDSPRHREPRNYAGRGPKGYRRSDERIREDVSDRLMWNAELDASDIEVRVADGEVTLTGVVEDRGAKRLAEDLVEDVFGVSDVHNQLKIRHGFLAGLTGEKADEREVTIPANRERGEGTRSEGRPGRSTGRDANRR